MMEAALVAAMAGGFLVLFVTIVRGVDAKLDKTLDKGRLEKALKERTNSTEADIAFEQQYIDILRTGRVGVLQRHKIDRWRKDHPKATIGDISSIIISGKFPK
jgi:hypothetical protein